MSGGGITSGPQPWWTLPGYANVLANIPEGYEMDPLHAGGIRRTPTSAGQRAGTYLSTLRQSAGFPDLMKIFGQAMGGLGGGNVSISGSGGGIFGGGGVNIGPPGPMPPVGGGTGTGYVGHIPIPDMTEAENASFARAKDQVGKDSRAAVTSLNDEAAAQGMLGSGAQAQGLRDVTTAGLGELGQVRRDQATQRAQRADDFARMQYQGDITQRGQDIAAQQAQFQNYLRMLEMIMGSLSGGGSFSGSIPEDLLY